MKMYQINENDILNAITKLEQKNKRLSQELSMRKQPIAVIGMACNFPGAKNVNQFWENLKEASSNITEVPDTRWHTLDGLKGEYERKACRWGGFIDDIYEFDPGFFNILAAEASFIDPQHRLFYQTTYQAIQHAGLSLDKLDGTNTGVYTAIMSDDYGTYTRSVMGQDEITMDDLTGNEKSFLPGRLSHWLKISGPSLVFSTACSSSLVALHYACKDIQQNAADVAIVGGVNLMLTPYWHIAESKLKALSEDGRCRAFTSKANGYVRGEGCGVVILQRLRDAIQSSANILAVIEGSAVCHTGKSMSLTAPNPQAQIDVITRAFKDANVSPEQISYLESHGSGTELGDRIELQAIQQVYRTQVRARPLQVGAVKTNIGHLEAASGMAGLIKTLLVVQHKQIPPNLEFDPEYSLLSGSNENIQFPTSLNSASYLGESIYAGVSSFGLSGSNAHIILRSPTHKETRQLSAQPIKEMVYVVPISARSESALIQYTKTLLEYLSVKGTKTDLRRIAYTLSTRDMFHYRKAFVASNLSDLKAQIESFIKDPSFLDNKVDFRDTIFLFPGFGEQSATMGKCLYQNVNGFKNHLEKCNHYSLKHLGFDLVSHIQSQEAVSNELNFAAMIGRGDQSDNNSRSKLSLAQTHVMLFSIGYALHQTLVELKIEPTKMLGYSLGEIVSWACSGIAALEDVFKLLVYRAQLIDSSDIGGMLTVYTEQSTLENYIDALEGKAFISATLCHDVQVVSGTQEAIEQLCSQLDINGIVAQTINIKCAMHCPLLESVANKITEYMSQLSLSTPQVIITSNVTGTWLARDNVFDAQYLAKHLCSKVKLDSCIDHVVASKSAYFELGPGTSLINLVTEKLAQLEQSEIYCYPLVPHRFSEGNGVNCFYQSLSKYWEMGGALSWSTLFSETELHLSDLPAYQFDNEIYKIDHRVLWQPKQKACLEISAADATSSIMPHLYKNIWVRAHTFQENICDNGILVIFEEEGYLTLENLSTFCSSYRQVYRVKKGSEFKHDASSHTLWIDPGVYEDHMKLVKMIAAENSSTMFLYGWTLASKQDATRQYLNTFYLVKALQEYANNKATLYLLTKGQYQVDGTECVNTPLWSLNGLAKALLAEGQLKCHLFDIEKINDINHISKTKAFIENQPLAVRSNKLWHKKLFNIDFDTNTNDDRSVWASHAIVIVGGFGAIGLPLATEILSQPDVKVILVSRQLNHEKLTILQQLQQKYSNLSAIEHDICDESSLLVLASRLQNEVSQAKIIILNCVGLPDNALLFSKEKPNFKVINAKQHSTNNLVLLSKHINIEVIINFSSSVTHYPLAGQSDYISANAWVNDDAINREGRENPFICSIAWSFWAYDNWQKELLKHNVVDIEKVARLREQYGFNAKTGLNIIEYVITQRESCVLALPLGKKRYSKLLTLFNPQVTKLSSDFKASITQGVIDSGGLYQDIKLIWEHIFGKPIEDDVSFLSLGGNSLVAMRMLAMLKEKHPAIQLNIKELFKSPTIAELYQQLNQSADTSTLTIPVEKHKLQESYELSIGQHDMWVIEQLVPVKSLYNETFVYQFKGSLNSGVLRSALNQLILEQDMFRTEILTQGFTPKQIIKEQAQISVEVITISQYTQETFLKALAEFSSQDIPLERCPTIKVRVYQLSENNSVCAFCLHHIIFDGHSFQVFINKLSSYYNQKISYSAEEISINPTQYSYLDYIDWQHKYLNSECYNQDLKFWEKQLENRVPTSVPYDVELAIGELKANSLSIEISPSLTEGILNLAKMTQTSAFAVMFSAFAQLLFYKTQSYQICVGSVTANRNHSEFDDVIGYFATPMALYADYKGDVPLRTTILDNFYQYLDMIEHAKIPYSRVIKDLKHKSHEMIGLFQHIMFFVHNDLNILPNLSGLIVTKIPITPQYARSDMVFEFDLTASNLTGTLTYNSCKYLQAQCEQILTEYIETLKIIVGRPSITQKQLLSHLKSIKQLN